MISAVAHKLNQPLTAPTTTWELVEGQMRATESPDGGTVFPGAGESSSILGTSIKSICRRSICWCSRKDPLYRISVGCNTTSVLQG
jgi:hypothetical protein